MRIGKAPRILLGATAAGTVTGLLLGIALVRWPDTWPGVFLIGAFLVFGLSFNLADVAINWIDRRANE